MAAISAAVLSLGLGSLRSSYSSLSCFDSLRHQTSLLRCQTRISRNTRSPLNRIIQACLQSNCANDDTLVSSSDEHQSEILFLGTGTSEGIPRVSCLTNPLKTCLDDLRDWTNNVQPHIPIYTAMLDLEVMKKTHYYLVDTSVIIPGAAVSELEFKTIYEDKPFVVNDLKIIPLPVWHGSNYRSLGFRFGNVCYISDVSDIPEETYPLLKDCDLLIMDALRPDRSSATHFGLPRALEEVRKIKPKRTLFTGMMHLMDHEIVSEELEKLMDTEGLDVQLSYDGLRVPISI